jgi:hypothetical protein
LKLEDSAIKKDSRIIERERHSDPKEQTTLYFLDCIKSVPANEQSRGNQQVRQQDGSEC